jgi:hypothetical protein
MTTTTTTTRTAAAVKLTVALPKAAIDAVVEIASEQGKTKTQVLREAIALKAYFEKQRAVPGTRFLIQRDDDVREIVFAESL